MFVQLANKQLKDTKGGYAQFLRENKGEAKVMEEKEKRVKEIEQSTIKAKSKVRARIVNLQQVLWLGAHLVAWFLNLTFFDNAPMSLLATVHILVLFAHRFLHTSCQPINSVQVVMQSWQCTIRIVHATLSWCTIRLGAAAVVTADKLPCPRI